MWKTKNIKLIMFLHTRNAMLLSRFLNSVQKSGNKKLVRTNT